MLAVCFVQCTSCTECDLVLVACITDAAPILTEREYMHGGAYGVGSSRGAGAGINLQPAYLSSAAHLEPVLTYKGEVCTGKFVFIPAKGYVKVRRVCMPSITAGWINRGIVDINHLLMRFHHQLKSLAVGCT